MPLPPIIEKALEDEAIAILARIAAAAEAEVPVLIRTFGQRLSHLVDRVGADSAARIKALLAPKSAPATPSPVPVPPAATAAPAPASPAPAK